MIRKSFNQKQRQAINGPMAAVIRYDQENDFVPAVIAQGRGHLAEKIISMAKDNDIPLQEDSLLVKNLIDIDLGENIPPQLYSVVAEILLLIEEMERYNGR
ncbi:MULTISPECIES: EscU/YscU/HrcU family type III secretion system export apparatus switch protein [Brevibacillus]|jgi:flagellar biosynthesis protein|uniref:Type III secretion exporter n=1 Tax=Brevibacillus borstelensis AK1 TaxID=1300222 RepID=M8DFI2_9BACL|nr:EscU/YscU/HrcU family type III secretion system export apparatus switch protein [Brevibacillus borstelensis]EMT52243.1 type III secretion exporter [Brevibacillus borstelensis AK1]KKX54689.1 flagellar biosynthesis protein FlhS [Brevibacillus borstelensis cifa_chp40]MCM3590195.1 EscU/YscU/HrcU family type III secretion system export apparatus switch protein [Brevibacillus borstelensis]MED1747188.1 EscU/YscU/HrcU family type III secretion system export apparatus switch protein [Brevibacillus bo